MEQDSVSNSVKYDELTTETQGLIIHNSINRILLISFGLLQIGYSYGLFFFEKTTDSISKYQIIIVFSWLIPLGGIIGSLLVIPFEKKSRRMLLHLGNFIIILATIIRFVFQNYSQSAIFSSCLVFSFRFIYGIGLGIITCTTLIFVKEMAFCKMTYYIGALFPMMFSVGSALTGLYACQVCRDNNCPSWNHFYTFIFGWLLSPIFAIIHSGLLVLVAKESPILLINRVPKETIDTILIEAYGVKYKSEQSGWIHLVHQINLSAEGSKGLSKCIILIIFEQLTGILLFNKGKMLHYFGIFGGDTNPLNAQTYCYWHFGLAFGAFLGFVILYLYKSCQNVVRISAIFASIFYLIYAVLYIIMIATDSVKGFDAPYSFYVFQGLITTFLLFVISSGIIPAIWATICDVLTYHETVIVMVVWFAMQGIVDSPFEYMLTYFRSINTSHFAFMLIYLIVFFIAMVFLFIFTSLTFPASYSHISKKDRKSIEKED